MKSTHIWFKAKRYGWGWYPVRPAGWLVLAIYLFILIFLFIGINAISHSISDTLIDFSIPFIGLTSLFLAVCYIKGEVPHWQWGIRGVSGQIWREIEKANHILLHCHPSPDPDSVGSVLAMKGALENKGKKVTVIQGDSEISPGLMHFPGAREIIKKNFGEIDLKEFNLFIILDSGSPEMISRKQTPSFPLPIKSIVIDHHASNKKYADINLVATAPSTTFVLFNLFKEWDIAITHDIALNLFIGMFTDTGGFKYPPVDSQTFEVAAELAAVAPDFIEIIFQMENCQDKASIYGQAIALNSIRTFCNDMIAISAVSHQALAEKNISTNAVSEGYVANILKSVVGWNIAVSMVEIEPGRVKASFRTRDVHKYDVSKLAVALGGGGHKAAAGAVFTVPLEEAVAKVVETAKTLYNL
jgi:phosphoesterase RecJ-like protein